MPPWPYTMASERKPSFHGRHLSNGPPYAEMQSTARTVQALTCIGLSLLRIHSSGNTRPDPLGGLGSCL